MLRLLPAVQPPAFPAVQAVRSTLEWGHAFSFFARN